MRPRALLHLGAGAALLGLFVAPHGCATDTAATVDNSDWKVAAVQEDVRTINETVASLDQRVDDLETRLSTLERDTAALQQSLRQEQDALQTSVANTLRTHQAEIERRVQAQLTDAARATSASDAKIADLVRLVQEENAKLQQRLNADLLAIRADMKKLEAQVNKNTAGLDDLARELQTLTEVTAAQAAQAAVKKTTTPAPAEPVERTGTPSHPDIDYTRGYEHTVKAGETLWKIARDYNVAVQDIVNCNETINNASVLTVGQKIFVPYRKPAGQPAPTGAQSTTP